MTFDFQRDTQPIDAAGAEAMFGDYTESIEAAAASEVDGVIDLSCYCSGTLRVHDGDLEVDELHLPAEGETLIVDGNLTVRGTLVQDFRAGFLIVFGNLSAQHVVTTALIFVSGDLIVSGTIFGNCTNYSTDVLGATRAKVLVSAKEHYFCLYGGRQIERIVDVYGDTPNLEDATDSEDALAGTVDGGHDEAAVAAILQRGESILR